MSSPIQDDSETKPGSDGSSNTACVVSNRARCDSLLVVSDGAVLRPSIKEASLKDGGDSNKPLKKRRVQYLCVPRTTLERQVASCWLDLPLHSAAAPVCETRPRPGWAGIVTTSTPTSGPYLYDELYGSDDKVGTLKTSPPDSDERKGLAGVEMSSTTFHESRDSATHAQEPPEPEPQQGYGPVPVDDSELEMETLTMKLHQSDDDKALGRKGFLAASVTPSPFPVASESAVATPTSGHDSRPKCVISRISIAADNMPFLLPDFESRPSHISPLTARTKKNAPFAAAAATIGGIDGIPTGEDLEGRGGGGVATGAWEERTRVGGSALDPANRDALVGHSAFNARLLEEEGSGWAVKHADSLRRSTSGTVSKTGTTGRGSSNWMSPTRTPEKPPASWFMTRHESYPKYSPLVRNPSKTGEDETTTAGHSVGHVENDRGAARPPQQRESTAAQPKQVTLLRFLDMQHQTYCQQQQHHHLDPRADDPKSSTAEPWLDDPESPLAPSSD